MSTDSFEVERIMRNGEILADVPGVKTERLPAYTGSIPAAHKTPPVEDVEPEQLAGLMAGVISTAMAESPIPSPMEVVTRLLQLKTDRGHKVVWTRFDINQLFALWTNKLESRRIARGSAQ